MQRCSQYLICITVWLVLAGSNCVIAQPTVEDVNDLVFEAKTIIDDFGRESFLIRMQHFYSGRFLSDQDKDKLYEMAKGASEKLKTAGQSLGDIKGKIEQYEGEDWDRRYGKTGLWRRLFGEIYTISASRCAIMQYEAMAGENSKKLPLLWEILKEIEPLEKTYKTGYLQYLKARTLGFMAQVDPNYIDDSKNEFVRFAERSDVRHETVFQSAIDEIRFLGEGKSEKLSRLGEELIGSDCGGDVELVVSLGILQRKYGQWNGLEKTLSANIEAQQVFGMLALGELADQFSKGRLDLETVPLIEVELAGCAASWAESKAYKQMFRQFLGNVRLHTTEVVYAYAKAIAQENPSEACDRLIEVSELQKKKTSKWLMASREEILEEATRLASDCYVQGQCGAELVVKTAGKLNEFDGNDIDDELQYVYAVALIEVGRKSEGVGVLERLIEKTLSNETLRKQALNTYCKMLVEDAGEGNAKRVISILSDSDIENDPNLGVFRAKALLNLGQANEAISCLAGIIKPEHCENATEVLGILSEVIGQIERYELSEESLRVLGADGLKLGKFCYSCLNGQSKRLAGLYAAESQIIGAFGDNEKLEGAERFLNEFVSPDASDIESVRCKARLLTAQGKYTKAANLWRRIASAYTNNSTTNSWRRWRAKYYELYCCAKSREIENKQLTHSIEVLQSSESMIPELWNSQIKFLADTIADNR